MTNEMNDASMRDEEPSRVGETIGRYKITRLLGRGDQTVVYAARDPLLKRRVAIKLLPAATIENAEQRRRLLREARAAAAVNHPNVAAVFDVGELGDVVFLAMEYVEGRSLRVVMDEADTALPEMECIRIARGIALGLAAAHEVGLSHRDLKPENVMIGNGGTVKLVDFGLAKAHGASAFESTSDTTQVGRVLGTPDYMSPEQARGLQADARSDVFAAGIVMFEMLARARPFQGTTVLDVLAAILRDATPPLPPSRDGSESPIAHVIRRCLAKDPNRRYGHAGELSNALDVAILAAAASPAQPGGLRRVFGLAALLVLAVVIATGLRLRASSDKRDPPPRRPPETSARSPLTTHERSFRVVPEPLSSSDGLHWISPFNIALEDGVTALASDNGSLAVTNRGDILIWGMAPASSPAWFKVDPTIYPKSIATNGSEMMAVDQAGKVWSWYSVAPRPTCLQDTAGIRAVAIARRGALLLRDDGTLAEIHFWDLDADGDPRSLSPTDAQRLMRLKIENVPGIDRVRTISARGETWLALRENGTVWSWAETNNRPRGAERDTPHQIYYLSDIVMIAAGKAHGVALAADGAVWAWGNDSYHQVGSSGGGPSAVRVPGLPKIYSIAAGPNNSLAIDGDGRVWEWGTAYEGELNNARAKREGHLPRVVPGLPPVHLIASSGSSSLAVGEDGLWAWGVTNDYKYWDAEVPPLR